MSWETGKMFEPQTYMVALAFMLAAMLSWGSWANTMKMAPAMPFQLFYWDYVVGVLLVTVVWALTLGSNGEAGQPFVANIGQAGTSSFIYALLGGALFNIANLFLVAAISIAGLAVAFPIGIGIALVVGVVLNYSLAPAGNLVLLASGVVLVLVAIIVDALAYKNRARAAAISSRRGVILALISGVLMGLFYPLVVKAQAGEHGFGPYAVGVVFALGVALCALPVNAFLMRYPLTDSAPVTFLEYRSARRTDHLWGIGGGMIWGCGLTFSLVAASAALVGPAVSYAVGQGATMVSAAWGVFVWREFDDAPVSSRRLIAPMFLLFIAGLSLIAIAPLYGVRP
jgi:glucose uptake protein